MGGRFPQVGYTLQEGIVVQGRSWFFGGESLKMCGYFYGVEEDTRNVKQIFWSKMELDQILPQ